MIAERIKFLREHSGMTQSELAKRLGITRSAVNAWEMGISIPSAKFIIDLSSLFHISSDYILGIDTTASLPINGIDEEEISILYALVNHFRSKHVE